MAHCAEIHFFVVFHGRIDSIQWWIHPMGRDVGGGGEWCGRRRIVGG
jgi:hypothetical protein